MCVCRDRADLSEKRRLQIMYGSEAEVISSLKARLNELTEKNLHLSNQLAFLERNGCSGAVSSDFGNDYEDKGLACALNTLNSLPTFFFITTLDGSIVYMNDKVDLRTRVSRVYKDKFLSQSIQKEKGSVTLTAISSEVCLETGGSVEESPQGTALHVNSVFELFDFETWKKGHKELSGHCGEDESREHPSTGFVSHLQVRVGFCDGTVAEVGFEVRGIMWDGAECLSFAEENANLCSSLAHSYEGNEDVNLSIIESLSAAPRIAIGRVPGEENEKEPLDKKFAWMVFSVPDGDLVGEHGSYCGLFKGFSKKTGLVKARKKLFEEIVGMGRGLEDCKRVVCKEVEVLWSQMLVMILRLE